MLDMVGELHLAIWRLQVQRDANMHMELEVSQPLHWWSAALSHFGSDATSTFAAETMELVY